MEKVRSEGSRTRRPNSNPSFTSVTVTGSITRFELNLINMFLQTLGVFRVTTPQSAWSRKYRETRREEERGGEEKRWRKEEREGRRRGKEGGEGRKEERGGGKENSKLENATSVEHSK